MNPLTLLEADNLTLLKGSSLLLRHYSLTIAAGQIIHLTGDNGSGKTTLLQALAGLITPQGGTIRRHAPHLYLGHRPGIKTTLTARENLRYAARLYHGMPNWKRALMPRLPPSPCTPTTTDKAASSPPGSSAAASLPASGSIPRRCGCLTNR